MGTKTHDICQERQDLEQQQTLEEKYDPIEQNYDPMQDNCEEGLPMNRGLGREETNLAWERGVGKQRRQKSSQNGNVYIGTW